MSDGALREPAHLVSPRAVSYWRLSAVVSSLVVLIPAIVAFAMWPGHPWWGLVLVGLLVAVSLIRIFVMPAVRYRIHRWEITPTAVFTRAGWLTREQRIAPLNRVQTVDSRQGAVMRLFGLASVTVTTASAAGPVTIDCLDDATARQVVAELTEIAAAAEGDAT